MKPRHWKHLSEAAAGQELPACVSNAVADFASADPDRIGRSISELRKMLLTIEGTAMLTPIMAAVEREAFQLHEAAPVKLTAPELSDDECALYAAAPLSTNNRIRLAHSDGFWAGVAAKEDEHA